MQKIKDFETFAAGYLIGLGIKKPAAEDICRLSVECRAFAAALSFYMFTDPCCRNCERLRNTKRSRRTSSAS